MNPLIRAVDIVKFTIPMQILTEVFQKKTYRWRDTPISIDEQILNQVIKSRVLVDCNLVGGAEVLIPLDGLPGEFVNMYEVIYRIPKDRTDGRSIVSVLSVGYGSTSLLAYVGGSTGFKQGSVTPVTLAGQAMADAMSPAPSVSTARVQLIGENTIMVKDTAPPVANIYLRCILAHDENMSHIQLRSIPSFTQLVILAVKSFIFNELAIKMDAAYLSGGQVLGRFKEIVDSYADAEQQYSDYLTKVWQKTEVMNDRETSVRLLRLMIGSHR